MSEPLIVSETPLLDGMTYVATAKDSGGICLSQARNEQVPDFLRRESGWYDRDDEWAIPFLVFSEELAQAGKINDYILEDAIRRVKLYFLPHNLQDFA